MDEVRVNDAEAACIKRLAELYEAGKFQNGAREQEHPELQLGLPAEKWATVLGMMEKCGFIEEVQHASGLRFFWFRISPNVVQAARQIDEKQKEKKPPRNIVEEIKETARGNPILAWTLIGFLILVSLITATNQLLELLKKLGFIKLAN